MASAKFRQRKKEREQHLEKTARDATQQCQRLSVRVLELEREVQWLKSLVFDADKREKVLASLSLRPPSAQ